MKDNKDIYVISGLDEVLNSLTTIKNRREQWGITDRIL